MRTPSSSLREATNSFRHQIHAVVQRRHQTNIGYLIIRFNLVVIMVPLQEDNGLPLSGLKTLVNALHLGFHVGNQVLITVDMGTAGRADLDMGEAALVGRVFLQKTLSLETPPGIPLV